ncbi:Speckle-type POZ protein [Araneus ventricosus]|uniref:Speckle-type POZ protein n=1 Tax=Araneus ventricosus TaxID=182803 RepID=A0A4Y2W941_ARAVE|nr:Speckle-type POZ protein [Araneus ventricosus]GBO32996.1 Speckle-type POZ protein [Araneus ventricosus]
MTKFSFTRKIMYGIRWTVENLSKMPAYAEVIGPDFYLAPGIMGCITFSKIEGEPCVFIRNKSAKDIYIVRELVLYDCNSQKLHEDKDEVIFLLEEGEDVDVLGRVNNGTSFDDLTNDTLVIDLCVGDERIPVHWSVLCSRSPYFKKMFDSRMLERMQNSVIITDSSLVTVKKLIQFLYTADFVQGDDLQELFDLYYAADKYEVMDLRTLCGHKIVSNVTSDNACDILQLFHRHNDKALKMEVMDFIRSHSDAVFQTEVWKMFEVSEPLMAELISFCLKKNC